MGTASLISTVVSLLWFTCVSGHCPDGWLQFQGSCYQFGRNVYTMTEAEHYCQQHGSHLVKVESTSESAFLKSFLGELKEANHWTGLTDRDIEGLWKWVGDDETASYTDWAPGDPNNFMPKIENCVTMRTDYSFQWTDEPCTAKYYPICEKGVVNVECSPAVG